MSCTWVQGKACLLCLSKIWMCLFLLPTIVLWDKEDRKAFTLLKSKFQDPTVNITSVSVFLQWMFKFHMWCSSLICLFSWKSRCLRNRAEDFFPWVCWLKGIWSQLLYALGAVLTFLEESVIVKWCRNQSLFSGMEINWTGCPSMYYAIWFFHVLIF